MISLVALGAGILPTSVFAGTLDEQFTCKSNAHTFITSLINSQLIDPAPIRVEANSVNAFRPAHGRDLAVYGLRVRAVFGFQPGDPTFRPGSGKSSSSSVYGAMVFGSSEAVEAQLRQAGSPAVVQQVIPMMLSAIVCEI
ncbi:hypothetical protein LA345_36085 (plasmid) [Burkholderia vietnamiensis]|nr:hypothetical protein [Burkholderia vietnamiensis]